MSWRYVKRPWMWGGITALAVGAAVLYEGPPSDPGRASAETAPPVSRGASPGVGARSAAGPGSALRVSVMGIDLDLAQLFEIGYAGGLKVNEDTRAALEALMDVLPAPLSQDDLQRIEWTLRDGLPKADADRAIALVRGYRGYVDELSQEADRGAIPDTLAAAREQFARLEAMRQRHFDVATADALFGPHDRHAMVTLEAMFVAQDASLPVDEKRARLATLRAALPAELQSQIPEPEQTSPPGDALPLSGATGG
ncbi:lipase secretion chaperone [Caldimonas brevitalea]|uniref:Lipase helper protein n=1 Tax=Caldimonas brevitalea TaxID=413882 RepID=A0A0G3BRJ4_9BURK|nr:lipase secretion chaperone [Caldimonas brevitalea]AKJ29165.1 hypothetical protein AAW51_2474 [Caldimonas brevitalea]